MALNFDDVNFENEIVNYKGDAVVDFWAEWCGPCRMLGPVVEGLSAKYEGKVKFGKVNVDNSPSVANRFGISSIPCVIFFKDGKEVGRSIGYKAEAQLEEAMNRALAK